MCLNGGVIEQTGKGREMRRLRGTQGGSVSEEGGASGIDANEPFFSELKC